MARENLRPIPVDDLLFDGGGPYWKECYERAVHFLMDNRGASEGMTLQHGQYDPLEMGFKTGHACVALESRGLVFDGVLQGFYEAEEYYREMCFEVDAEWPREDALRIMGWSQSYGGDWYTRIPWVGDDPAATNYLTGGKAELLETE